MSGFVSTSLSLLRIACVTALFGTLFIVSGYVAVQWSLSAEEFDVPEVVGMPLAEARDALTQSGLLVEVDGRPLTDNEIPEGHVLQQNPLAGTAIKRQRSIRLILSSGAPKTDLPMVVGDALPRAQIALEQKDVGVEYVARVYSDEFGKDLVIGQQPQTAEMTEGGTVPARLLVSLGPRPRRYLMPDLVYRNIAEVTPLLERLGFRVREDPARQRNPGQPAGTILQQRPVLGFPVRQGDRIVLVVNR